MGDEYRPRRWASERAPHVRWQFQERTSSLRSSRSNEDKDVHTKRASFGVRHSSIRSSLSFRRGAPESALHAEDTTSTQTTDPSQQQFLNGKPTASLNGQRPGYVRTFSQSSSSNGYNAETIPNMAYIQRSASIASTSPPAFVRYRAATPPNFYTEAGIFATSEDTFGRGGVQQLGIAEVLASDLAISGPNLPGSCRINGRLVSRHGSEKLLSRSGAQRRVQIYEPSQEYFTRNTSMRIRIEEVDEEEGKHDYDTTTARDVHGTVIYENDFFGDSIPEEEPSSLRVPSHQSLAQRDSRAAKLFALNPDPPSHSGSASGSIDDLAAVRRAQELPQPHTSYRLQQYVRPAASSYPPPTPLREHIFHKDDQSAKNTPDDSLAPLEPRRRHRYLSTFRRWFRRSRASKCLDEASATTSPTTYWVLMFFQFLIWSAILTFFTWRISTLEPTVPFQCYELKAQLFYLAKNGTLPIANATSLYDDDTDAHTHEHTPSSIFIPDEYQAQVRTHCLLTPVNQAAVLAGSLDVLFMMALLASGLANLLHFMVRHQIRRLVGRNAVCDFVAMVVRVYVLLVVAGVAGLTVVFVAWAVRRGVF